MSKTIGEKIQRDYRKFVAKTEEKYGVALDASFTNRETGDVQEVGHASSVFEGLADAIASIGHESTENCEACAVNDDGESDLYDCCADCAADEKDSWVEYEEERDHAAQEPLDEYYCDICEVDHRSEAEPRVSVCIGDNKRSSTIQMPDNSSWELSYPVDGGLGVCAYNTNDDLVAKFIIDHVREAEVLASELTVYAGYFRKI